MINGKEKVTEKKKKNRYLIVTFALISLLFFNGCIGVNEHFREIRNIVIDENVEFDHNIEFSMGPGGMLLLGLFVNFAGEEDGKDASELIGQVSRVQIGIYKNDDENIKKD